ncbi:hypothetical protein BofuT4_uP154330.1 [Botrytis cinerea T4]|uniref:Uncharacterized protein n=1 Tax=Botryotinia fuckeliana (strain T4) TaxID=999810 RepID=G2YVH3_BOTF4|nr:hypothetical protein BofuT4_uP154330.1 [Botrytis cinerea T4]
MYAGTVALRMSDGEVCVCRRNEERGRMTADSCVVLRYNVYVQVAFYSKQSSGTRGPHVPLPVSPDPRRAAQ